MVVYIQNKRIKLGVDEARGGGICFLCARGKDGTDGDNVINTWDTGRFIQQSYYGNQDGSTWNGTPWMWNPVQGGSWDGQPSKVVQMNKISESELNIQTIPRNWGGCGMCNNVLMTTNIILGGEGDPDAPFVRVSCKMSYKGTIKHKPRVQEIPACFFNACFSELVYKELKTGIVKREVPGPPGQPGNGCMRDNADPKWVGYVNPQTGQSVFIRSPSATKLTVYRVDIPGNPIASNCSYMAPLITAGFTPPCETSYTYKIELGKFDLSKATQ
jgi:hypothetical protein